MKLAKLSLVAALLLSGGSAFALENTKIGGDLNFNYMTSDIGDNSLFSQDGASGQAALNLKLTTDLSSNVTGTVSSTTLTTLGLENSIVSGIWAGGVPTQNWISEAYVNISVGKTNIVAGRQAIDTPLVFTETYNMAQNTFDGILAVNTNIANTTIVTGFVGNGNGVNGTVVGADASVFNALGGNGAYVVGAVNNTVPYTNIQAWYYNVTDFATGLWLQADTTILGSIDLGAQYASIDLDASDKTSSATAVRVGYKYGNVKTFAAYSQTGEDGAGNISNLGTGNTGRSVSKLYTEAQWNFGYVGLDDTTAMKVGVETALVGANIGAYYTNSTNATDDTKDMTELAVSATKSYGDLDTTLVVLNSTVGAADSTNTVQVQLSYNF